MAESQAHTPEEARRAAAKYIRNLREMKKFAQEHPATEFVLNVDVGLLGFPAHKSLAINLAKRLFRLAVTFGAKFQIDRRNFAITTDFLDLVKALMRIGNNFRVVAAPNREGTAELTRVCEMRGIEYAEKPPRTS